MRREFVPYRYREDIATADAAFDVWGKNLEELFTAAADAVMNVMVENPDSIAALRHVTVHLESESVEMLLYRLLEELIFYKDAETLLLRIAHITVTPLESGFSLEAGMYGEDIIPGKHELNVDIKAVTLHRFRVEQTAHGWEATVVVDI